MATAEKDRKSIKKALDFFRRCATSIVSETGTTRLSPSGTTIPWLLVSKEAQEICKTPAELAEMALLLGRPVLRFPIQIPYIGVSGIITRERVEIHGQVLDLALKRFWLNTNNFSGIDQFRILDLMRQDGYQTITPLMATKSRFLSLWYTGPENHPNDNDPDFVELGTQVKETISKYHEEGLLNHSILPDRFGHNYFRVATSESKKDAKDRFVMMDPVFVPVF